MALEDERRQGRSLPSSFASPSWVMYSEHVRYVEQLRRFHAEFPPERVLVLIYDDYRNDNEAIVRKVQRFLEIDDTLPVAPVQTMQTVSTVRFTSLHPISRRLRLARHRPDVAGPIARTVHALSSKRLRVLWRHVVYTDAAPPDEQLMLELRRRSKDEVHALSEYLGRDLVTLWGYDGLG
jgi:Sulfotransferase domain